MENYCSRSTHSLVYSDFDIWVEMVDSARKPSQFESSRSSMRIPSHCRCQKHGLSTTYEVHCSKDSLKFEEFELNKAEHRSNGLRRERACPSKSPSISPSSSSSPAMYSLLEFACSEGSAGEMDAHESHFILQISLDDDTTTGQGAKYFFLSVGSDPIFMKAKSPRFGKRRPSLV